MVSGLGDVLNHTRQRVANNLRRLRQARDMSQTEVGRLVGCSHALISKWERGEVPLKMDELPRLALALGVSEGDILGLSTDPDAAGDAIERAAIRAAEATVARLRPEDPEVASLCEQIKKVPPSKRDLLRSLVRELSE